MQETYSPRTRDRLRFVIKSYMSSQGISPDKMLLDMDRLFPDTCGVTFKKVQQIYQFLGGVESSSDKVKLLIDYMDRVYPELSRYIQRDEQWAVVADMFGEFFIPDFGMSTYSRAIEDQISHNLSGLYVNFRRPISGFNEIDLIFIKSVKGKPYHICGLFSFNSLTAGITAYALTVEENRRGNPHDVKDQEIYDLIHEWGPRDACESDLMMNLYLNYFFRDESPDAPLSSRRFRHGEILLLTHFGVFLRKDNEGLCLMREVLRKSPKSDIFKIDQNALVRYEMPRIGFHPAPIHSQEKKHTFYRFKSSLLEMSSGIIDVHE